MRALILLLLIICVPVGQPVQNQVTHTLNFDGNNAFTYLTAQCDFGYRPPGSDNLSLCRQYIAETLESMGWIVKIQNFTYRDTECANIIATINDYYNSSIILGAHYDTRPLADNDPNPANRNIPVLGANDGASGVAALMELARVLPEYVQSTVELVFFDAEDSGGIDGWNWIQGSTYYVTQLDQERRSNISAMILLDMIGDASLRIPREIYSSDSLQDEVWSIAASLGYSSVFLNVTGSGIYDDHYPFIDDAKIPALDIIHYPFPSSWHTIGDTPDKCSPTSLETVGKVVEYFVLNSTGSEVVYTPDPQFPEYLVYIVVIVGVLAVVPILYLRNKRG
ncbi:MAG: M28 family peptidase [Candidatus Thorarchaeota archaeon]